MTHPILRVLLALVLAAPAAGLAAICNSQGSGLLWNAGATWSCGAVPTAADDVTILAGHTITINSAAVAGSLAVQNGAILQFGNNNTARTLAVGAITLLPGGTLRVNPASNTNAHALSVSGNMIVDGTLDLQPDAGSGCNTTFAGAAQTVSGGGTATFRGIVVNMAGATIANVVEATMAFTMTQQITFTDGLFKLSAPVALAPGAAWTFNANAGFWLNHAGASVTTASAVNVAGGLLRVSAGTFTATANPAIDINGGTMLVEGGTVSAGNAGNEELRLTSNAASAFQMTGGTVEVSGRFRSTAANALGSFSLSGGTLTVGAVGNSTNGATNAPFFLGSGTDFAFTGGTIVIRRASTGNPNEYDVRSAGTVTVSRAGTLQLGDAGTPAGQVFQVNSVPPVGNFVIFATNTPNATLVADLQVRGNWTNNGSFTAGATTVTFQDAAAQVIGGSTASTFSNLTLNNTAGLSLSVNAGVTGTLDFASATGNVSTGANTLSIGAAGAITNAGTSRHVVGNLSRAFLAAAVPFTYAIGDGTRYTPATLSFSALGAAGSVTFTTPSPTGADHPNTTNGANPVNAARSVNRYWTILSTSASGTASLTLNYLSASPIDLDASVVPASFVMARAAGCSGAGAARNCGVWSRPTLVGAPTSTQASAAGISIVSGASETDFVVGEFRSAFAREREFIYTRELY